MNESALTPVPPSLSERVAVSRAEFGAAVAAVILLATAIVLTHEQELGTDYLRTVGWRRLTAVVSGTAPSPWQYRVLWEHIVVGFAYLLERIRAPQPQVTSQLAVRWGIDALALLWAYILYRTLRLPHYVALVGLMIGAWANYNANYNSDLSFNTHGDVLFFLVGMWAAIRNRPGVLLVVVVLGSLSRETSLLLIPIAWSIFAQRSGWRTALSSSSILYWSCVCLLWGAVFVGLRAHYGLRSFTGDWGNPVGMGMLRVNLGDWLTWLRVLQTVSLFPILALLHAWRASTPLRFSILLFVCVWLPVHALSVHIGETQKFLVPMMAAFVPAVLALCYDRVGAVPTPGTPSPPRPTIRRDDLPRVRHITSEDGSPLPACVAGSPNTR